MGAGFTGPQLRWVKLNLYFDLFWPAQTSKSMLSYYQIRPDTGMGRANNEVTLIQEITKVISKLQSTLLLCIQNNLVLLFEMYIKYCIYYSFEIMHNRNLWGVVEMECHSLCRFLGDVLEIYRHCPFSTVQRGITVSYQTVNLYIFFIPA